MRRLVLLPILLLLPFLYEATTRMPASLSVPADSLAASSIVPTLPPPEALADSLYEAVLAGDSARVALALAAGAPVDLHAILDGYTPLHRAVEQRQPALVQQLLAAGANPNVFTRNARGNDRTPLHRAAELGDVATVEALLAAGARVDTTTAFGETPLHGVETLVQNPRVIALLLEAGADPNAATVFGATPLHRAAQTGSSGHVRQLLAAGASPSRLDRRGQTALHIAARAGYTSVVAALLEYHSGAGPRDLTGRTALDYAIESNYPDIASLIQRRTGAGQAD